MNRRLHTVLSLSKIWIVLLSTSSAAAGFILAAGFVLDALAMTVVGVFLLGCGSAACNQLQDRIVDARMDRTKNRPLPAGVVNAECVLLVGLSAIAAGLSLLALVGGTNTVLLGAVAGLWYNGIYYWLKRKTSFAAVPGGVVGALPPLIGWTAGGGSPVDGTILAVAVFLFLWQVPHFWLLLLRHAEDFRRSGLPVLTNLLSLQQLSRITFVWIVSTVVASVLLSLFVDVGSVFAVAGLASAGMVMLWKAAGMVILGKGAAAYGTVFRMINFYALLVLSILSLQAVV